MRIKLILNPTSGRKMAQKSISVIKKILSEKAIEFDMSITQSPGEAANLSREAAKNNFDIIVAAGGDGTIHEVVNGMVGSNSTLGIIPLGVGNDFAKAINIPSNLEAACLILRNGIVKLIDVGRVNDKYFINSLGIGFDAFVARESRKIRWSIMRNWIYLYTVIRMLFKYEAPLLEIRLADITLDKKVLLVAIGNGKSSGGGFLLTPEAQLDDGLLDVCIIDNVERRRLLWQVPKALKGRHGMLPYVTSLKTKKITVTSPSLLLAHADGEILESNHFEVELLPKGLKVIVPEKEDKRGLI